MLLVKLSPCESKPPTPNQRPAWNKLKPELYELREEYHHIMKTVQRNKIEQRVFKVYVRMFLFYSSFVSKLNFLHRMVNAWYVCGGIRFVEADHYIALLFHFNTCSHTQRASAETLNVAKKSC